MQKDGNFIKCLFLTQMSILQSHPQTKAPAGSLDLSLLLWKWLQIILQW